MTDTTLSVVISADTVKLQTQIALAKSQLRDFTADIKKYSDMANAASKDVSAMGQATEQFAMEGLVKAQQGATEASAALKALGGSAAGSHMSMNRIMLDARELFDELSSGRAKMAPGTLARLATQGFGVSGGMLAAGAGAAVLVGGLGYLIYEAIEAQKRIEALVGQADALGRSTEISNTFITEQVSVMSAASGVNQQMAEGVIQNELAQRNLSETMLSQINQLLPKYVELYGDEGPKQLDKFSQALNELSTGNLKRLDEDTFHLTSSQYELIDSLLASGNTASAQAQLLEIAGQRNGVTLLNLDQQIDSVKAQIDTLTKLLTQNSDGFALNGEAVQTVSQQIGDLTDTLNGLIDAQNREKASQAAQADQSYKEQLQDAQATNKKLDERGDIIKKITQYQNDYNQAQQRGDASGANTFLAAKQEEVAKLQKLDQEAADAAKRTAKEAAEAAKQATKQRLDDEVNALDEQLAVVRGEYSKERAILVEKANDIKAALGASSNDYRQAYDAIVKLDQDHQATLDKIAADGAETDRKVALISLKAKEDALDAEVSAGKITAQQKYAILLQLTQEEQALAIQSADAQIASYKSDTLEYAQALNAKRVLAAQNAQDLAKIAADGAAAQKQTQRDLTNTYVKDFQPITNAFSSTLDGMLTGQKSLQQSILQIEQSMFSAVVKAAVDGAAKFAAEQLAKVAASKAANTTILAQQTAAASAGKAADAAAGSASVMGDAHKAAAGAYSAVAGIPIVGPALAPVAAGVAFAAVSAFDMFSAEGGFDIPAGINPVVQTHAKEMILPAPYANVIRGLASDGGGDGGGDTHHHYNNTFHIHESDGPEVTAREVVQKLGQGVRSGYHLTDQNLRKAFR